MSKIIDDIVKTCNEIDARRNKEFAVDTTAAVKSTAETIVGGEYSGDPETDAAIDATKESDN